MKIGGKEIGGPCEDVLVLPRMDGDVVFRCRAVLDMEPFNALVSYPTAPQMITKGGKSENFNDPTYKQKQQFYNTAKLAYIVINSIQDAEWDTVDEEDPKTWKNWEKDLRSAGLSDVEVQRVLSCVLSANSLDEAKLTAAREAFLRGQTAELAASSGQSTEQESTQSGEPASD